jgi:uncharacterized protein (DUF1330 family)
MIVQSRISNEEQFGKYRQAVMPLIEPFGGKHVRGGAVELLEGQQDGHRIALFKFPSMEAFFCPCPSAALAGPFFAAHHHHRTGTDHAER